MDKLSATDRRSFLKSGALIAAPVAAVAVPAAAFADDGSRARLARLEDERSVEALHRQFLRHLNGAADCGEFIVPSDAVDLGEGLRAISEDMTHEAELVVAADGLHSVARQLFHNDQPVSSATSRHSRFTSSYVPSIRTTVAP